MEGRAHRRCAKAPFSHRSWDMGWVFSASAEGNARGPSGSKPHGGGGASEGKCRPEAILLAGVRASTSATVTGGEWSRSESRRCHRSEDRRCEWSGSGESDAGSARSGALARSGNFRESGLLGSRRPGARKTTPLWRRSGRSSPLFTSGIWKVRRDGSGSALQGVGSCARRRRSRSRRGICADKRKDRERSKTRDCWGWASPFRTDGRRKAGGPSGGSGGRVGPRSTCETDGTKKFQRAKEPWVGKQRWRYDPTRRSLGDQVGERRTWRVECRGICFRRPRTGVPRRVRRLFRPRSQHSWRNYKKKWNVLTKMIQIVRYEPFRFARFKKNVLRYVRLKYEMMDEKNLRYHFQWWIWNWNDSKVTVIFVYTMFTIAILRIREEVNAKYFSISRWFLVDRFDAFQN